MKPFLTPNRELFKSLNQISLTQGDGIEPIVTPPTPDRNSVLCTPDDADIGHEKTVTSTGIPSPMATGTGEYRSPFRLMISAGRLTDLFEFLTTYYDGIGTDEALDILRRFHYV